MISRLFPRTSGAAWSALPDAVPRVCPLWQHQSAAPPLENQLQPLQEAEAFADRIVREIDAGRVTPRLCRSIREMESPEPMI